MLLRVLLSTFHNPWFNLAIEECYFRQNKDNQIILFLWRNYNTVVIGRAQNPWKECNTRRINKDGVHLARRSSGGGAVFHDLGNTCFTFICSKKYSDIDFSTNIILDGLSSLGINAKSSGRNDLVIQTDSGEKKISGSAYRENINNKLHHGTLLLHSNIDKLVYYLNPDIKKLKSKGITSIHSRVTNLNELMPNINHQNVCLALQKAFCYYFKSKIQPEIISLQEIINLPNFTKQLIKQSSWEWNFGAAPIFTHQLDDYFIWGGVTIYLDVKNGIINNSKIFTDSLYPEPLEELAEKLKGTRYNFKDVKSCCDKYLLTCPKNQQLIEMTHWLTKSLL